MIDYMTAELRQCCSKLEEVLTALLDCFTK